jgi:hypothetical protein
MTFDTLAAGALLCLLILWVVVRRLQGSSMAIDPSSPRPALRLLVLMAGLLALYGAVERLTGWDSDVVLAGIIGLFLIVATTTEVAVFWEHWKALWLRSLVGDRAAKVLYVLLGAAFVGFAGWRGALLARGSRNCAELLHGARDSHERMWALQQEPQPGLRRLDGGADHRTCGRYVELDKLR